MRQNYNVNAVHLSYLIKENSILQAKTLFRPLENIKFNTKLYLVQGNFEQARRDYSLLNRITEVEGDYKIMFLSYQTPDDAIINNPKIVVRTNLDDIEFHETCRNCHFIIPLISPEKTPQYFKDTLTSSVTIGMSYNLIFIAHEKVGELYPIVNISYIEDDSLIESFKQSLHMNTEDYNLLRSKYDELHNDVLNHNIKTIKQKLNDIESD